MAAQTQSQMGESSSSTPLSVDNIYKQILGLEKHRRVHSLGFGAIFISIFGATFTYVFGVTKRDKCSPCIKAKGNTRT